MPLMDSTAMLIIGDPKPEQRCYRPVCPRNKGNWEKTKLCARCRLVRYCSKTCQQADWRQHRNVCREPQLLDIGAWITVHETELKWAAAQALGGYNGPNLTSTHAMVFRLVRADRLPAEQSAGPFFMFDAVYMPLEMMTPHFPAFKTGQLYSEADHEEDAEIKRTGGLGFVLSVFEVEGMPRGTAFWFRRFKLGRLGPGGLSYIPNWRWLVKEVTNDAIYDADILHAINTAFLPITGMETAAQILEEVD